jgi:hypothetical protein
LQTNARSGCIDVTGQFTWYIIFNKKRFSEPQSTIASNPSTFPHNDNIMACNTIVKYRQTRDDRNGSIFATDIALQPMIVTII